MNTGVWYCYGCKTEWTAEIDIDERARGHAPGCATLCSTWLKPLGEQEASGFQKFDSAKIRMELLPPAALTQVAKVFTYGARKYADENYLKGTTWRRYIGAALRHIWAFAQGEDKDEESGESHLAHAACCLLMLMELQRIKTGTDDRVKS